MSPSDRQAVLARRLGEARRRSGLSATEVAARIHRGRSSIHEWEAGNTSPTAVDVAALADVYGCSADWLLGRDAESGFLALVDPRCERLLLKTGDLKEFLGRVGTVACVVHEETRVERSIQGLAALLERVLQRGKQLDAAAAKGSRAPPADSPE